VSFGAPQHLHPRSLECDAQLTRLCVTSEEGVVDVYDVAFEGAVLAKLAHAFRSPAQLGPSPAHFDVARGLILVADGVPRARLLTLGGATLCEGPTSHACFGVDGNAYSLSGGVVHRMTRDGLVLVDGPSDLVELAPHARGLIAVDRGERAHVIDLDVAEDAP
jgi:hypothetical protein